MHRTDRCADIQCVAVCVTKNVTMHGSVEERGEGEEWGEGLIKVEGVIRTEQSSTHGNRTEQNTV